MGTESIHQEGFNKIPIPAEKEVRKFLRALPTQCPECGEKTDSLKCYTLPSVCIFIGIAARFSRKGHVCCPKCMRKKILLHGMTYNIITANLLWLIFILPWMVIQFLRTFTKGHSFEVVDILAGKRISDVEASL